VQLLDPDKRPVDPDAMPLIRALRGETVTGQEGWVPDAGGDLIPIVGGAAPIRNRTGEIIGAISELVDARQFKSLEAELRAAAEHQATLYRELTHRVKNHLHLVAGLVALETRDPAVTAKVLGDRIKGRLQTLAAVYNSMTRAETAGHVEARAFIENVLRPYESAQVSVSVTVAPPDLTLSSDQAGPIGMLLNEAVCNSCKHAFPDRDGRITVELRRDTPGRLTLEIADDGVGRRERPPSERVSHGLNLMQLHARQLNGEFAIGDRPGGGTTVCLDMPEA
jgi:two-component sensor histidine kinase